MLGQNKSAKLHTWIEERLSDYIDNQLSTSERARVEQHIGECTQCRASLESTRWTIALVKQAPVPATRRSFTLAVPAKRTQPSFGFGLATFATALATLALIAVIGVDVITRMGSTTAFAPEAQNLGAPTQAIALAPKAAEATKVPEPTKAPVLSAAPQATQAAKAAGASSSAALSAAPPAPFAAPTNVPPPALSSSVEASPTRSAQDSSKLETATQPARAAVGTGVVPTATAPLPTATAAPTQTATPVPTETPAPTTIAQAQRESATAPTSVPPATSQPIISPVRAAEIALLFGVIFFGTLAILLRRRR